MPTEQENHPNPDTGPDPSQQFFPSPLVTRFVGITFRQLDYWARTDLLGPSGDGNLYSFTDVVRLKIIKRLLDAGMSLKRIRAMLDLLEEVPATPEELAEVTLLSDGRTVFAAKTPDEVSTVFQSGHGIFGLALGPLMTSLTDEIRQLDHAQDH